MTELGTRGSVRCMFAAWLAASALGMGLLLAYSLTPGALADAPPRWPARSGLVRASDRPTIVMIAHPHCSCTRASIAELARLMTRLSGTLRGYVVFIKPDGVAGDWRLGRCINLVSTQAMRTS